MDSENRSGENGERSLLNSSFRSDLTISKSKSGKLDIDDTQIDKAVSDVHRSTGFRYPKRSRKKLLILLPVLLLTAALGLFFASSYSYSEVQYLEGEPTPLYSDAEELPMLAEPSSIEMRTRELNFDEIDAKSVYAYNPATRQIYYESNIDERRQIASITKLMSGTIVLDMYNLEEEVTITQQMLDSFPDELSYVLGIKAGDRYTIEELFDAMMISSYNDVTVLLAVLHPEGYDGFIEEMNKRAQQLGMSSTRFSNPQGYDLPDNYSTARDVQRLVAYAMKYERVMENASVQSMQISVEHADGSEELITLEATNKLLGKMKYMKGLKTGFTADAGPSLVGYFDAGEEHQLVTIILGGNGNRFDLTEDLYYLLVEVYR